MLSFERKCAWTSGPAIVGSACGWNGLERNGAVASLVLSLSRVQTAAVLLPVLEELSLSCCTPASASGALRFGTRPRNPTHTNSTLEPLIPSQLTQPNRERSLRLPPNFRLEARKLKKEALTDTQTHTQRTRSCALSARWPAPWRPPIPPPLVLGLRALLRSKLRPLARPVTKQLGFHIERAGRDSPRN